MAYLSTSADLIQRTYRFLKEASATPTVWPSSQVVDYIDEAHAYVAADLNLLATSWLVRTSANVASYDISAQAVTIAHVLHMTSAGETFIRLRPGSFSDIVLGDNDPLASGTAFMWALASDAYKTQIRLYPAPDTSALSGLLVYGNATPHPIVTSASPLQRHILPLVPIRAAWLAWMDLGVKDETQRMSAMYYELRNRWRVMGVDLSPGWRDGQTLGYHDEDLPYGSVMRPGVWGPLTWGR